MKKLVLAVAFAGALAYFGLNTNYKRLPDCWDVCKKAVCKKQDYSKTLISELEEEQDSKTADEMIESGFKMNKRIFGRRKAADEFIEHPYDLRIRVEHSEKGEAAYLVDLKNGKILPIYEGDQVGNLEHRLSGVPELVKEEVSRIFEQAKEFTNNTIDG